MWPTCSSRFIARSNILDAWLREPLLTTAIASSCNFSRLVRNSGGRQPSPSFRSSRRQSTASTALSSSVISKFSYKCCHSSSVIVDNHPSLSTHAPVATGEWFSLEDGGELRQYFIHGRWGHALQLTGVARG